jgi:hypothetical protein
MVTHTAAYDRFMASMAIGFMEWHDGVPYDLDALAGVSPAELAELEALLIERKDEDWRDVEALARIGTSSAWRAVKESMAGPAREVRIRAAEFLYAAGRLDSLDDVIVEGLRCGDLGDGLAQAERLAAAHPSQSVIAALLEGALCGDGRAVRFAAILCFLHGKTSEPIDWSKRQYFAPFMTSDRAARRQALDALCRFIGVDGSNVRCG